MSLSGMSKNEQNETRIKQQEQNLIFQTAIMLKAIEKCISLAYKGYLYQNPVSL